MSTRNLAHTLDIKKGNRIMKPNNNLVIILVGLTGTVNTSGGLNVAEEFKRDNSHTDIKTMCLRFFYLEFL